MGRRKIGYIAGIVLSVILVIIQIYILRYAKKAIDIFAGETALDGDMKFFTDAITSRTIKPIQISVIVCISIILVCVILAIFCTIKLFKSKNNGVLKMKKSSAFVIPLIFGIVLIIAGLAIRIPGGALTTYEDLNGETSGAYVFDDCYSAIDEYVGGDAYNYIIGASLVSGSRTASTITKCLCILTGVLCLCASCVIFVVLRPNTPEAEADGSTERTESTKQQADSQETPVCTSEGVEQSKPSADEKITVNL